MEMKKLASFRINHDTLKKGLYVSRIDGDVVTYDLRMVVPNCGEYPSTAALHTFEHLFATFLRSAPIGDAVVYVGPMGCRTGFYLLTRDALSRGQVLDAVRAALHFLAGYTGAVPGAASSAECGNWLDHDLPAARELARDMETVLQEWTPEKMDYDA